MLKKNIEIERLGLKDIGELFNVWKATETLEIC